MSKSKWLAVVAAALVAGLVLGNLGSAVAAESTSATPSVGSTIASCGLGIGRDLRDAGGRMIDIVAKLTGKSVDDVRAERQAGKSLADIAQAEGVSSDKVVDEALAPRKAALGKAVTDGTITQAQADAAFATMKSRLSDRIDSTSPGRAAGAGGGRGGCGSGLGGCGGGGGCGGAGTPVVTQ